MISYFITVQCILYNNIAIDVLEKTISKIYIDLMNRILTGFGLLYKRSSLPIEVHHCDAIGQ